MADPTAMHAVPDVHDTPARELIVPGGLGGASVVQEEPFHPSASAYVSYWPTAVHRVANVQDTPFRNPYEPPVRPTDQTVPFQRAARSPLVIQQRNLLQKLVQVYPTAVQFAALGQDTPCSAGWLRGWSFQVLPSQRITAPEPPTEVHAEDEVQDTPDRAPPPVGLGVGRSFHAVPFHHSESVMPLLCPTAMHPRGVQDTPDRLLSGGASDGFSVIIQPLPFQRSASATCTPAPLTEFPTAVHDAGDVQDTPARTVLVVLAGSGVDWTDQPDEARAAPGAAAVRNDAASTIAILRPRHGAKK
jgi:hypothetical protein